MKDTTAKYATLRDGSHIAGQLSTRTPECCLDCGIKMIPQRVADIPEDHAPHRGRGYCGSCYYRRRYRNQWGGPPPVVKVRWKAVDLAAEWEFLHDHCGLTTTQAAERLGVPRTTLDTALSRARKYAERDRRRAELVAAEAEAHDINNDMIAYAVHKGVAA